MRKDVINNEHVLISSGIERQMPGLEFERSKIPFLNRKQKKDEKLVQNNRIENK
jgi:putative ubiquitin-RnfH superfamily antitoxin RatB of RatAB toxin-antitoxin module